MYLVLTILIVLASVLLTFFVLVQNSKGGGLSAGFSSSNQIMGVRKTTDFLEKATWTLVVAVVLLSVAAVWAHNSAKEQPVNQSSIQKQVQEASQTEPGVVAPNFGESPEASKTADAPAAPAAPAQK